MASKRSVLGKRLYYRLDGGLSPSADGYIAFSKIPQVNHQGPWPLGLEAYWQLIDGQRGAYVWTGRQTELASRRGWYISLDWRIKSLATNEDVTEEIKGLAENGDDLAIAAIAFLTKRKLNGRSQN